MEVVNDSRRILLLSSSTIFGSEYLDHAEDEIHDFLGKITRVLFIPFALHDRDAYAAKARARFARLGYQLDSLHEASDMHAGLKTA
jgi:dipeptidase E